MEASYTVSGRTRGRMSAVGFNCPVLIVATCGSRRRASEKSSGQGADFLLDKKGKKPPIGQEENERQTNDKKM